MISFVFQEDIVSLEKQVTSLKSSLQDRTAKLTTSQETVKRLEQQLEEVCVTLLFCRDTSEINSKSAWQA